QVTVSGSSPAGARAAPAVQIQPGQQLVVSARSAPRIKSNVDVARATAWQSGKMFFDNEPLGAAAERINRYAHHPIVVDPAVADVGISGVFNTGDSAAFIEAITAYFPVKAERGGSDAAVHLSPRE